MGRHHRAANWIDEKQLYPINKGLILPEHGMSFPHILQESPHIFNLGQILAAWVMAINSEALRLAPPTSAPSISGWEKNSAALFPFTDPP